MQQRFSFIRCLEKPPPRTHIYTRGEEKRRSEERREERQYDGPVVFPIRHSCVRRKSSLPPWGIFVPRTTSLPEKVLARSTPFLPPRSPLNKYLNRTTTLGSRRCSFRLEIRRYYAFPSHARTHARRVHTTLEERIFSEIAQHGEALWVPPTCFIKRDPSITKFMQGARSLAASTLDRWTLSLVIAVDACS